MLKLIAQTQRRYRSSKWQAARAFLALFLAVSAARQASAEDHIHVVGSSTVFPFMATAAEEFGEKTRFATPIVEQLGTGGGFKLFCSGLGATPPFDFPDIANASRRMKDNEKKLCSSNAVDDVIELKIGFDGIVLANAVDAPDFALTQRQIYLALAARVPSAGLQQGSNESLTLVPNFYQRWSEISPELPDTPIAVYGPPETSGTRDAFNALALKAGCRTFPQMADLEVQNPKRFDGLCSAIREDQRYIRVGENDNMVVQKLRSDPMMLGILPYSFVGQNSDMIKAASVNGITASPGSIRSAAYPITRPLYIYVKRAHARSIPGIKPFLLEIFSEGAMGTYGYLADKGFIPVSSSERLSAIQHINRLLQETREAF